MRAVLSDDAVITRAPSGLNAALFTLPVCPVRIVVSPVLRFQIRAEFFNLLNRVNLAPPSGTIGGGFGQSSDTAGDFYGSPGIGPGEPFNVQFALKILF